MPFIISNVTEEKESALYEVYLYDFKEILVQNYKKDY